VRKEASAIADFLTSGESKELQSTGPPLLAMKYHLTGYNRFLDVDGYPAIAPPWAHSTPSISIPANIFGKFLSVNILSSLRREFMTPHRKITAARSSLEATSFYRRNQLRQKFRAFDSSTGKLLWKRLCVCRQRYAATYAVNAVNLW